MVLPSSSSSSWLRVLAGLQKVAEAAAAQTAESVTFKAARAAQHGRDVAASFARMNNSHDRNNNTTTHDYQQQQNSPRNSSSSTRQVPVETSFSSSQQSKPSFQQADTSPSKLPEFGKDTRMNDLNGANDEEQAVGTTIDENTPLKRDATRILRKTESLSSTSLDIEMAHTDGERQRIIQPLSHEEKPRASVPTTKLENVTTSVTENKNNNNNNNNNNEIASENQIREPDRAPQNVDDVQNSSTIKEGKAVPSTRVGRALGFANLGLGLAAGTVAEGALRLFGASSSSNNNNSKNNVMSVMNDRNSDRLAASLCRMRGAALKMGQMLSIQDESLLPSPALARALQQVRQGAEAMPRYQLVQQLESQLGMDWRDKFVQFDMHPFAAASIGQCHKATILQQNNNNGGGGGKDKELKQVVVKVQYPGVAQSIESDLSNLSMIVKWSGLAPKGLFVENVIRVGQEELKVECDYVREKKNQKRIKQLVESDDVLRDNKFVVPDVVDALTSDQVITSEFIPGGTIDKAAHTVDQEEKNRIGRTILYLTMRELFDWRFMQTDPNWGNFLYDVGTRTTGLIDFGATREYSKDFVDGYLRIVWASANRDEETLMAQSYKMGFLTGDENSQMLRAHKLSGFTVGEPFWKHDEPFDFRGSSISERMGEHTSVFLKHRLTPPPEEVYTLHRKLAGAYMLCIKLGAVVRSRDLLEAIVANHQFDDGMENPLTGQ